MSSKTRIVVLHLKELIYTGIFAVLGILFLLLLIIMFLPGKSQTPEGGGEESDRFVPGKYTTSVILGNSSIDVEVVVDANNINSIRLVNLDEAVTTMYPLMEPALNDLAIQICEKQSLEDISYSEDNKYTSQVLLEAISSSLEKAEATPGSSLEAPRSRDGSSEGNSPEVIPLPQAALPEVKRKAPFLKTPAQGLPTRGPPPRRPAPVQTPQSESVPALFHP